MMSSHCFGGHFAERRANHDRGGVDEHVELAERRDDVRDQRPRTRRR